MEVQDFFYLCKIYHPAWIQVDRRNVQQSELWLYRPLYHKTGKHALRCEIIEEDCIAVILPPQPTF